MGRIEADIALESWLFRFRSCSVLFRKGAVYPTLLSTDVTHWEIVARFCFLREQTIHRVPVNGLIVVLSFYG